MAGICHVVDVDWLSGTDPAGGFLGGSDTYFCPKETRVDGGNNHARPGNRPLRRGNNHIHDANNCVAYINNDVRPGHDRVRSGNNRLAFGNDRWRLFDTYFRDGEDRKSTRLNSSHQIISYAVFCLKKKSGENDHAALDHLKA